MRVDANSVLCVLCGKWIHGRCAGVLKELWMQKCEVNIEEAVELGRKDM